MPLSPCSPASLTTSQSEPPDIAAPAEQNSLQLIAEAINNAGLATPAIFALRTARPLGWLGAQMLWVLEPLLQGLGVRPRKSALSVSSLALLIEQEGSLDCLIEQLEVRARKTG